MDKNTLKWIDAKKHLPIIDDEHEEGEIPYLGIYCDYDDYDEEDEDFPFMDIVYFYGKGWKNSRWEKVYVKYWLEIPAVPKKKNDEKLYRYKSIKEAGRYTAT